MEDHRHAPEPLPDSAEPTTATSEATPANPTSAEPPKRLISEARLRANRANAKRSTGPKTEEGKRRSSLNATRHGVLSHTIHLPEEELAAYTEFTARYITDLAPIGAVETELAKACADLQFRLHRLAAAEHNLFALGYEKHSELWEPGQPESHTAFAFAETLRRSKDPLATITIYEQRLSRRLLQTLKQLEARQAERRAREQEELETLYAIARQHPEEIENIHPNQFGFVCSERDWRLYRKSRLLLHACRPAGEPRPKLRFNAREVLAQAA